MRWMILLMLAADAGCCRGLVPVTWGRMVHHHHHPSLVRQHTAISRHHTAISRHAGVMMAGDDNDEEALAGFGLQSLWRTSLFVTLWWALWSLYDLYLTPYSPWPELAILVSAAGYSLREDLKRDREGAGGVRAASPTTPWPCTSEGCLAEDD